MSFFTLYLLSFFVSLFMMYLGIHNAVKERSPVKLGDVIIGITLSAIPFINIGLFMFLICFYVKELKIMDIDITQYFIKEPKE